MNNEYGDYNQTLIVKKARPGQSSFFRSWSIILCCRYLRHNALQNIELCPSLSRLTSRPPRRVHVQSRGWHLLQVLYLQKRKEDSKERQDRQERQERQETCSIEVQTILDYRCFELLYDEHGNPPDFSEAIRDFETLTIDRKLFVSCVIISLSCAIFIIQL